MNTPITNANHARVLAEIKRRNLKIERSPGGIRVHGDGVDILVVALDMISPRELLPFR